MDTRSVLIRSVEAANHPRIGAGDMKAIVGERFTRSETRSFSHDLVALDDEALAIRLFDHPLATQKLNPSFRSVLDGDEINEGVGLIQRQAGTASMINETIQSCP